jgi:cytosine/adenosine deaminase-related metal-dependent hydrolase
MPTCIHNTTAILFDGEIPVVRPDYSIVFDTNEITDLGPAEVIKAKLADREGFDYINGGRHITIPGLVNTHHHLFQTLTRAMPAAQDAKLFDWLTALYARWRHLEHEAVKLAAQVALAELLLSGGTTSSDHFYMFPPSSDVRIESVIEAAESVGIRLHVCRGSMSVGQSGGGLPPDDCVEDEQRILADYDRVVDLWHDRSPLAMVRVDLAPCSPFNVSPELFRATAEYARLKHLLLHTHAAETLDEEKYCLERFGMRPIAYLESCGWLGSDVYLAHCVHLSDDEMDLLARTKTGVAHCPSSNMRLGSGPPPVRRMLNRGVKVGLAVDGSSSNDGGHMLGEARQALLLQRAVGGPSAMRVPEAFRIATLGGAAVLNRPELGRLAPGCAADLAMFRTDDIALAGAVAQDPLGALLLCHVGRADRVIVNGRTVVQDGHLTFLDEHALAARLNECVAKSFR